MVQLLGLCALNTGGPGSNPGQGTRSHMKQLRVPMPQHHQKILHIATKDPTCCKENGRFCVPQKDLAQPNK